MSKYAEYCTQHRIRIFKKFKRKRSSKTALLRETLRSSKAIQRINVARYEWLIKEKIHVHNV
jgi:hypothetical protein